MSSVREIAELAGVSKSTISLVLNNKPGVSGVMRKRILSTLETLQETEKLIIFLYLSREPTITN